MRRDAFPDPATFDFRPWTVVGNYMIHSEGIVAFGTPPTPANLREAYSKGIFPWPTDGIPLPWHCPEQRAILFFDELHISRSLAKARRASTLTFTIDKDFRAVMHQCSRVRRPEQLGTWITEKFKSVFGKLHEAGIAHSVEAWSETGKLVGGLYGVDAGGIFCGESMFHLEANASRLALLFLIDHLRSRGATCLDSQVMTPHMKALGARDVTREEFLRKLKETQKLDLKLF